MTLHRQSLAVLAADLAGIAGLALVAVAARVIADVTRVPEPPLYADDLIRAWGLG